MAADGQRIHPAATPARADKAVRIQHHQGNSMSDTPPTLSAVLIAKDEEQHVTSCLSSFWDDVDECVFVDTGSSDGTVAAAEAFSVERGEPDKLKVGYFEWCDDFSAARTYADSLATGDWLASIDLDERVIGLDRIRSLFPTVADGPAGFMIATGRDGEEPEVRPKVMRAGCFEWVDPLHEIPMPSGEFGAMPVKVDRTIARWVHTSPDAPIRTTNLDRNLHVARVWAAKDPSSSKAMFWVAETLRVLGRYDEAAAAAKEGLSRRPVHLGLYVVLAQDAERRNDGEECVRWLREGLGVEWSPFSVKQGGPVPHGQLLRMLVGLTKGGGDVGESVAVSAQQAIDELIAAEARTGRPQGYPQAPSHAHETLPRGPGGAVLLGQV